MTTSTNRPALHVTNFIHDSRVINATFGFNKNFGAGSRLFLREINENDKLTCWKEYIVGEILYLDTKRMICYFQSFSRGCNLRVEFVVTADFKIAATLITNSRKVAIHGYASPDSIITE